MSWIQVGGRDQSWSARARKRVADGLTWLAYRIDPHRPSVTSGPGGSHTVKIGDMPLARIEPGMVRDTRERRA